MLHTSKKPIELHITHLNNAQKDTKNKIKTIQSEHHGASHKFKDKLCQLFKDIKTLDKKCQQSTDDHTQKAAIYVLDFDGDIKASAVAHLREEISAIISVANRGDEVVLRLESGGGQVHAYGLAAAQLVRIKEAGLKLTICVDKIAASGGYMMACTADKIIASDFAVIGSIGVVSQLPNFHEFLKKHDVQFEQFTAGEYKRTVTIFGENDDEDRAKHQADIERIHELFKGFIHKYRPQLDLERVATGEVWFGEDALELGLIDEIGTSDAYLLDQLKGCEAYLLHSRSKPTLAEKIGLAEQLGSSVTDVIGQTGNLLGQALAKFSRP
ncbi:protease SohB [Moraxella catarrhalis]|uniref:protease SohB n=1 Tax=Moraxella catarrhalis TaxID=480 RepID=UPI000EA9E08E|nr:protease SohB [Moraxella catarrhalis]AZQ89867.1 peptidase S49 family protein [Moraxella catarrhalis]RKL87541.1 protease SohB [Moraxella catarrhalis]